MSFFKAFLFIFTICFASFSMAQDEWDELDDLDYLEAEDIACEDLPAGFDKYSDDVQLSHLSLQKSLTSVTHFLRKMSKDNQLVKAELLEMIESLEQISALSSDNSMLLSDQAYNMSYFLSDCLNPSSSQ